MLNKETYGLIMVGIIFLIIIVLAVINDYRRRRQEMQVLGPIDQQRSAAYTETDIVDTSTDLERNVRPGEIPHSSLLYLPEVKYPESKYEEEENYDGDNDEDQKEPYYDSEENQETSAIESSPERYNMLAKIERINDQTFEASDPEIHEESDTYLIAIEDD